MSHSLNTSLDAIADALVTSGRLRPAPEAQQSYDHIAALRRRLAPVVALAERMVHQLREEPAQLTFDGKNHVVVGEAEQTGNARTLQANQHRRHHLIVALQVASLVRTERQQDVLQAKQRNLIGWGRV